MKYSKHKVAKVKMYMTEDDKKVLEKELNEGKLSSITKSRVDSLMSFLQPVRLKNSKGCFGGKGLNRKEKKKAAIKDLINKLTEEQKTSELEK
jgi:hypothetical protein